MQRTNIHMPEQLIERLDKYCAKTGVLRAEFIRRAVADALKKVEINSQAATKKGKS